MRAELQYRAPMHRSVGRSAPPSVSAQDHAGVVAPAPIIYGGAFLLGALVHGLLPIPVLPLAAAPLIGIPLLACGAALAVWSRRTMERAGTNVHPARPAIRLVVTGPYGFSRNPMYLARTLLYVGLALLANALWILAAFVPLLAVIHYGVIAREERYLDAKFGDAYRQYRTRVRRWL